MLPHKKLFTLVFSLLLILESIAQFPIDGKMYFFRDVDGLPLGPTRLSYIDNYVTGNPTVTNQCLMNLPAGVKHNALGANSKDGFLYYVQTDSGATFSKVYRLDQNCVSTYMFSLTFTTIAGCFDNKGRYWVVSQSFPYRLSAYDITTGVRVKGPFNLNTSGIKDIAYNIYDCHFYYGDDIRIRKIDTTGRTVATYTPGFKLNQSYGGTAIGIDGKFYGLTNQIANTSLCNYNFPLGTSDSIATFSPGPPNDVSGPGGGSDMATFAVIDSIKAYCTSSYQTQCTLPAVVSFMDSTKGMVNVWEWDFGDGNTSTLQNPSHAYTTPGTYTVRLIGKNTQPFCIPIIPDTTYITVVVSPGITVNASINNVSCFGLNNGSITVTVNNGTAPYTYGWSNGSTSDNTTGLAPGPYSVTITDANGCSGTSNYIITQPSQLQVMVSAATTICSGQSVTMSANANGGTGTYHYLWLPGNSTGNVLTTSPSSTTNFSITVNDDCESITNTIMITVNDLPVISVTPSDSEGCAPLCITFTLQASQTLNSYSWNFGDGTTSNQPMPQHCYNIAGNYDVSLSVIDVNGCTANITYGKMINVYPQVIASFNTSQTKAMVYENIVFTDQSTGATQWQWDFGNGSGTSVQHPSYSYDTPGTFTVKLVASNSYGCTDSTYDYITVVPELTFFVPNAFTPNNDNNNDIFSPEATGLQEGSYELMIFDRWGILLFKSNNPAIGWDGKINQTTAQIDTYVWKVNFRDLKDKPHTRVGAVNLVR